ncbi:amino acid permease [Methanobacterium sp. SMA-27]|uniref:amino acid permease n=1 Tax=Methanobacterium sp. SMA-27 TaxID=1495336 RepID=UPI00064F6231|nr:amino acid permease [Methanobacterium sp. SMA-27]
MSELNRSLGLYDVVSLVIGTIVGADIYIAASFGAGLLGPFSVFAWVIAGVMAIIIALCFAECSSRVPQVGGPYAYAKRAFGDFTGFLTGWSLLIASWSAIAVFPLAFVAYLNFFIPHMSQTLQIIIKFLFVLFLTIINYFGVRQAGRANDILTILKIAPILILTFAGLAYFIIKPSLLVANFTPIAPLGFSGLGSAIVLIFWAYVGFELVTVPSDEIINSKRTIPLAIGIGMGVIALFYILTNFVILGLVPWFELSTSTAPLALAGYALVGAIGAGFLTLGALLSISGSDEAGILSSARIPYAMAADGLLPRILAKVHPKYGTPYIALIAQSIVTLIAAIFGTIDKLIILSVFTLLFCYLLTCISVFPLRKKFTEGIKLPWIIPVLGVIISIYIMTQCAPSQIIIGSALIILGIPVYVIFAPRTEIKTARRDLRLGEDYVSQTIERDEIFLAKFINQVRELIHRTRDRFS